MEEKALFIVESLNDQREESISHLPPAINSNNKDNKEWIWGKP